MQLGVLQIYCGTRLLPLMGATVHCCGKRGTMGQKQSDSHSQLLTLNAKLKSPHMCSGACPYLSAPPIRLICLNFELEELES